MQFEWSWWVILTIVIYAFGILCAWGIVYDMTRGDRTRKLSFAIAGFMAGFILVNVVTWNVSAGTRTDQPDVLALSRTFGLESGEAYPVQIGGTVNGSIGEARFYGGIFSSAGSVTLQPGSSIKMSFASGNSRYILEIPTAKVTFIESPEASVSRVQLFLKNQFLPGDSGEVVGHADNCKMKISSLVLIGACNKSYSYTPPDFLSRRGLAPVVNQYLDSATIVLSPEVYERLLGS